MEETSAVAGTNRVSHRVGITEDAAAAIPRGESYGFTTDDVSIQKLTTSAKGRTAKAVRNLVRPLQTTSFAGQLIQLGGGVPLFLTRNCFFPCPHLQLRKVAWVQAPINNINRAKQTISE